MRFRLLTLVCVASIALASFASSGTVDETWQGDYLVRFSSSAEGVARAEVRVELTWKGRRGAAPEAVELSMADGYPGGYGQYVHDFAAFVPDGVRAPRDPYESETVDGDAGVHRLPVMRGGRAAFSYSVLMEHDPEEGIGFDETPHALQDSWFWTGRSLFISPGALEASVRFEIPDGDRLSVPLELVDEKERLFRAASVQELRECYLITGKHLERTLDLEGSTFLLVIDPAVSEGAKLFEKELGDFVAAAAEAMGGPPPARCLVAITKSSEGGGAVHGRSGNILVDEVPTKDGPDQWKRTLCHETFHLWNPQKVGFRSREMWFSEGFTDYYAHKLLARTGSIDGERFLRVVTDWASAYTSDGDSRGLREAGELGAKNNTLIYRGGALAALCMDIVIQRAKKGRSLDDVMQGLYREVDQNGGQIDIEVLQDLLARFGGGDLNSFLDDFVGGSKRLPLAETLALAGLELKSLQIERPMMEGVGKLMQCPGMTVVDGGIEINRTDAGKLRADDLVVEMGGKPVTDFNDMLDALAGRQPGEEINVVVLRDGKRKSVDHRLGGRGEELPTETIARVVIEPLKKTDSKARKVRQAMFGL